MFFLAELDWLAPQSLNGLNGLRDDCGASANLNYYYYYYYYYFCPPAQSRGHEN